jgi:hypothetical protein
VRAHAMSRPPSARTTRQLGVAQLAPLGERRRRGRHPDELPPLISRRAARRASAGRSVYRDRERPRSTPATRGRRALSSITSPATGAAERAATTARVDAASLVGPRHG